MKIKLSDNATNKVLHFYVNSGIFKVLNKRKSG